jgi:hypothetical protein
VATASPPNHSIILSTPKGTNGDHGGTICTGLPLPPPPDINDIVGEENPSPQTAGASFQLINHQYQPYLAILRSIIDSRRECCVGAVKVQPEEGETSCFLAFSCSEIHGILTNRLQTCLHPTKWPQTPAALSRH